LIPTLFGLPLALLGVAARREEFTKDTMHGAAGLSLLGLLVALQGLLFPQLFPATNVSPGERPKRRTAQGALAMLCGLHVGLAVNSFIAARRGRG
jgi:hypothetical protein